MQTNLEMSLKENLLQSAEKPQTGANFQHDNNLKHIAMKLLEWLWYKSLNVL